MQNPELSVLLVEDDIGDVVIVERALNECKQSFKLENAGTIQEAIEILEISQADVMLLDLSLPDNLGLSALRGIKTQFPDLPIVVLTGLSDDAVALQALEHGAQDYLVKGMVNEQLLERSLRYAVLRQQVQSENRKLLAEMKKLARQDPLTGVFNRLSFSQELNREWQRALRYNIPMSCIVLDIDHFKKVNDTYGHSTGDKVLQNVASTLESICRVSDIVGRLGGEEFCVLLPEIGEAEAVEPAERIRREIASLQVVYQQEVISVTASLGIAGLNPDIQKPQSLVDLADEAMFAAKKQGRDRAVCFKDLKADSSNDLATAWEGIAIQDLMMPIPATIGPGDSPAKSIELMVDQTIDSLPVVDPAGKLVGELSADDFLNSTTESRNSIYSVSDLMKTRVVSYSLDSSPADVCGFLCRSGIHHVFITDNEKPVGVVRRIDFIRGLSQRINFPPQNPLVVSIPLVETLT